MCCGRRSMLFNQQRLPVHFGRLVNAQQVKQGRRNVSQFAVTQAFNLLRRIDQNIHDLTDGVSRIGRAGFSSTIFSALP